MNDIAPIKLFAVVAVLGTVLGLMWGWLGPRSRRHSRAAGRGLALYLMAAVCWVPVVLEPNAANNGSFLVLAALGGILGVITVVGPFLTSLLDGPEIILFDSSPEPESAEPAQPDLPVHVREADAPRADCPLCLSTLGADEELVRCPSCAVEYHRACVDEMGAGCAALGCDAQLRA